MRALVLVLLVLSASSATAVQNAAQKQPLAEKPPEKPAPTLPAVPLPPESYSYDRAGRRDPFLNLLGAGTDTRVARRGGEGAASLTVGEISVRGILESRGTLIAMVQGPDNKTYLVHQGDRFADGTIKAITPQALIIVQEVNDPLSLVKQREIRKQLRSVEDGKQ